MKHFLKTRKTLSILLAVLFITTTAFASGIFNRDDQDIYSGMWRIWKTFQFKTGSNLTMQSGSTLTLDSGMTFTGNNIIEASDIANLEKTFDLQLVAAFIDGTGVMGNDASTAPGMAETDNVPAIVWASSAEQTKVQWTFRRPTDYVSGLGFRILMSASATSALQSIDWQLWINDDGTAFDAGAIAQDAVAPASSDYDTKNEILDLAIDATGESAISAGSFITVDIWNAGTSDDTTEIKGIQAYYTAAS